MQRGLIALALFAVVAIPIVFLGRTNSGAPTPASVLPKSSPLQAPAANDGDLIVEGLSDAEVTIGPENLVTLDGPMQKLPDATAVAGTCWTVPEGPNHHELNPANKIVNGKSVPNGTAQFSFTVDTDGDYVFWAHKWWCCSCGDSFRYAIDNGALTNFVSDSNYRIWEWARTNNGRIHLSKGAHTLLIANREDGFRVDRFLLTTGAHTPAPLTAK